MLKQVLLGALVAVAVTPAASAQNFKMTTPFAPGVAVPDKIESSIGTLNLDYGYPSGETVDKIYDNLDRSRALQAYLLALPRRCAFLRFLYRPHTPLRKAAFGLGGMNPRYPSY